MFCGTTLLRVGHIPWVSGIQGPIVVLHFIVSMSVMWSTMLIIIAYVL